MNRALLFIVLLGVFSCSKDAENTDDLRLGQWVEVTSRTDTISFELLDNMEILSLMRGYQLETALNLPQYKSGPYEYDLNDETISLRWLLSSDSRFNDYYFKIEKSKLFIGNFYEAPLGEILEFERID